MTTIQYLMNVYLIAGLVVGCIAAIAAAEITGVTFRTTGVLNFGFAGLAYGIARVYYFLCVQHSWPQWIAAIVSICVIAPTLGALLYLIVLRLLTNASVLTKVIVTIGIGVTTPYVCNFAFGDVGLVDTPGLAPVPVAFYGFFGWLINLDQIIVMSSLVVILIVGFVFLKFTEVGLLVRATMDSPAMTSLNGTSPNVVSCLVWSVSTGIAGLVGVEVGPIIGLSLDNYAVLAVGAFGAVLIAKLSNVGIAVLVSLALGVCNALLFYFLRPMNDEGMTFLAVPPFAFVLAYLLWEARPGVIRPSIVTRALDRAIAPSHDTVETGDHGRMLALRLHYPTKAAEGKGTVVNARTIRAVLLTGIIAVIPVLVSRYWANQLTAGLAVGVILLSFTLIIGEGGMIWLSQIAFAGIGAGMTEYLTRVHHFPILAAIVASGIIVMVGGMLVATLTTRISQLQAALATLAFAVLTERLILAQPAFAGVDLRLPSFLFGVDAQCYFLLGVFCISALLVEHYRRSTAGLAASAVRWSFSGAASIGIDPRRAQMQIAALAAFLAAVGGGCLCLFHQDTFPDYFTVTNGFVLLSVVVTIGIRSNVAALVAGLLFVVLPTLVQKYLPLSLANLPFLLFGVGSVFILKYPDGLFEQNVRQALRLAEGLKWIGHKVTAQVDKDAPPPVPIGADTAT